MTKVQKVIFDHYKKLYSYNFSGSEVIEKTKNHLKDYSNNFKIFIGTVEASLESRKPRKQDEYRR